MLQAIRNALPTAFLPKRRIDYLVVHHTGANRNQSVESILNFWKTPPPKGNGWSVPGYHIIIRPDGSAQRLLADEKISNGVKGFNAHSLHVCCIGGEGGKDERTAAQKATLENRLAYWLTVYPNAKIVGHRDLSPDRNHDGVITPDEWLKKCPGFNAITEYAHLYKR